MGFGSGAWGGGPGDDGVNPVISNVMPPEGLLATSLPDARAAVIEFDVTDVDSGFGAVILTCKFSDRTETLVVYDGTQFLAPFLGTGGAVQSAVTAIPNGFHFALAYDFPGWPANIDGLAVFAIDIRGNIEGTPP